MKIAIRYKIVVCITIVTVLFPIQTSASSVLVSQLKDLLRLQAFTDVPFQEEFAQKKEFADYYEYWYEIDITSQRRSQIVVTIPKGLAEGKHLPLLIYLGGHNTYSLDYVYHADHYFNRLGERLAKRYVTASVDISFHETSSPQYTLLGERIWTIFRLQKFLLKKIPSVHPENHGIIGLSLGGEMAMWAGALNPDFHVVVTAGFFNFMNDMKKEGCQCWYLEGLPELADFPDIFKLIAPRYLMAQVGRQDGRHVPLKSAVQVAQILHEHYKEQGVADRFYLVIHNGGHVFEVQSILEFLAHIFPETT